MSRDGEPGTTRLSGYSAPALQIRSTQLTFDIHPGVTTVHSVLRVERVIEAGEAELVLDGQELELVSIAVDGHTLSANEYQLDEDSLTLFGLPDQCDSDCNSNEIADACDIADGTALDEDFNGIPDECQSILEVPSERYPTIQSAIDAARHGEQ